MVPQDSGLGFANDMLSGIMIINVYRPDRREGPQHKPETCCTAHNAS